MGTRRIVFENAIYHIMTRGNNRQEIFCDAMDRAEYLHVFYQAKQMFSLKVYAYALMPNHVHLLLETPLANISAAMKFLNWTYVTRFNYRHMRSGHLFENRYKSKLVQKDRYLMSALKYIHNNPVKAGLCDKPEDYRWSSHKAFLSAQEGLADVGSTLAFFDRDPVRAAAMYREFFKLPLPDSEWALFDKSRSGIIGDKEFRARCRSVKKLQPVQ